MNTETTDIEFANLFNIFDHDHEDSLERIKQASRRTVKKILKKMSHHNTWEQLLISKSKTAETILTIFSQNKKDIYHIALEIAIFIEIITITMERTKGNSMLNFYEFTFTDLKKLYFIIILKINKTFYKYSSSTHTVFYY